MTTLYARAADVIRRGWCADENDCNYCWWCNGRQKSACLDCGMEGRPSDAKCPTNPEEHIMAPGSGDPVHVSGCPLGEILAELDAAQHHADEVRARAILDCAGFIRVKAACRRRIVSYSSDSRAVHQEVAAELEAEADSLDRMSLADGNDSALRLLCDLVVDLRRPEQGELTPWKSDLLQRAEAVIAAAVQARAEGIKVGDCVTWGKRGCVGIVTQVYAQSGVVPQRWRVRYQPPGGVKETFVLLNVTDGVKKVWKEGPSASALTAGDSAPPSPDHVRP